MVDIFLTKGYAVNTITIELYNNDIYMGNILIETEEFLKIKASGLSIYSYVSRQLTLDQKIQVEMNIKSAAKSAKEIVIEKIENTTTDETTIDIKFKLKSEPNLAYWQKADHPLYSIDAFETLVSDLVKLTFEADESIDRVNVRSDADEMDARWNTSSMIGKFSMGRIEFEEIVDKWDDLRYIIYDEIEYSPIFLMDYKSQSTVTSLEFDDHTLIEAYYEDNFKSIDTTINLITKDCDEMISSIFDDYPDVTEVEIKFKAKVPAREGEISSDGIHSIVKDFVIINAQRDIYEQILTIELTPIQTMYNYEMIWQDRASELMIRDNMFTTPAYFREIEFSDGQSEVTLTIDSCLFEKDVNMKTYIAGVKKAVAKGNTDLSLEEEVYNQLFTHVRKLIFDFHPPFLDTVNIYIERVYLDTTGHEIDVTELGTLVFEKQEEAHYWFQTEHPDDLEWLIELEDELDIDDDEVLCQT